ASEVRDLMALLREFLSTDLPDLKQNGVKVSIIGDRRNLDLELRGLVATAERETKTNDKTLLQIAFNYGGRDEILRAVRRVALDAAAGRISADGLSEEDLEQYLDTTGVADPDVVIRTSGEKRTSNFLIWQAAYAEYVFTDVLWPDFSKEHFDAAISEFNHRERRYGGVDGVR
ncbi:MAG: polyprenyl diphosphate synthase, partial [Pseudomonadota bacterium]